jgi:hypothetical protein
MDSIFTILIGVAVIIYGTIGLIRKQIELGIGGGRSGGRPLGIVALNGISGRIFSIACIIGGLLILVPRLYVSIGKQEDTLLLQGATGLGFATFIIGFLFACIIQLAMSFGSSTTQNKVGHEKSKNDLSNS